MKLIIGFGLMFAMSVHLGLGLIAGSNYGRVGLLTIAYILIGAAASLFGTLLGYAFSIDI